MNGLKWIFFVALVLHPLKISEFPLPALKNLQTPAATTEVVEPKQKKPIIVTPAVGRKASLSKAYDFKWVEQSLRVERYRLAACLLKNKEISFPDLKMNIEWNGTGKLKKIDFTPAPGSEVESCIFELIQNWQAPPHPALQPFSYRVKLVRSKN